LLPALWTALWARSGRALGALCTLWKSESGKSDKMYPLPPLCFGTRFGRVYPLNFSDETSVFRIFSTPYAPVVFVKEFRSF